jgi:hypothetical protein
LKVNSPAARSLSLLSLTDPQPTHGSPAQRAASSRTADVQSGWPNSDCSRSSALAFPSGVKTTDFVLDETPVNEEKIDVRQGLAAVDTNRDRRQQSRKAA